MFIFTTENSNLVFYLIIKFNMETKFQRITKENFSIFQKIFAELGSNFSYFTKILKYSIINPILYLLNKIFQRVYLTLHCIQKVDLQAEEALTLISSWGSGINPEGEPISSLTELLSSFISALRLHTSLPSTNHKYSFKQEIQKKQDFLTILIPILGTFLLEVNHLLEYSVN